MTKITEVELVDKDNKKLLLRIGDEMNGTKIVDIDVEKKCIGVHDGEKGWSIELKDLFNYVE